MLERRLFGASMLALAAHLIAGLAMALVLRHGLETNPEVAGRIRFIAEYRPAWTLAWLTWTMAAFSILYFYRAFAAWLQREPLFSPGFLGAVPPIAAAAVILDLSAQAIEIVVLPGLESVPGFLAWHRRAVLLTGFGANGLYTLAAGLLAWAGRDGQPDWVNASAAGVVTGGIALSAAALADSVAGMFWSNVALVPALLAWLAGVGVSARRLARG